MQRQDFLNLSVSYTLLRIYTFLWILSFGQSKTPDVHVTCIHSKDCILPCSFPPTRDEVVIQWYQQEKLIYSFQEDEDEPDDSSLELFSDEISKGNASLLIKDTGIKNRGRYKCTVNTTKTVDSIVIVKVKAPIARIILKDSPDGTLQCSINDVYPAPVLTWSTEPRAGNLQPVTRMKANSNGLYSVDSMLMRLNSSIPLTYICTVTPKYSTEEWKASLLQNEIAGKNGQDLVIPCVVPQSLKMFNLTWTFTSKKTSKDILTYNSGTQKVNYFLKKHAELKPENIKKGDGSLHLDDLDSSKHFGKYTCIISGPKDEYTVQTSVSSFMRTAQTGNGKSKLWVLAVVVAVLGLLGVLYYVYRKYRGKSKHSDQETEMQGMHKGKTAEELPAENTLLSEDKKGKL